MQSELERRALDAAARAYREVPFYARLGCTPGRELSSVPLITRAQLRAALPRQWIPSGRDARAELGSGELEVLEAGITAEDRCRLVLERGWWTAHRRRAMRKHPAAAAALDRGAPYREAVLAAPPHGRGTCHVGELSFAERVSGDTLLLNQTLDVAAWARSDPPRMIEELARHGTVGLDADPPYLAALARHASAHGQTLPVSGYVSLSGTLASQPIRRAAEGALRAPLFSVLGGVETGVLAVETEGGTLVSCDDAWLELLPARCATPGARSVAQVVVTSLDRAVQPLIRFVTGELVAAGPEGVTSHEGRLDEAVLRPDGALVTAGAIDRALAAVGSIAWWQASQPSTAEVALDVVPERGASGEEAARGAKEALVPLCAGMRITARMATTISAEPSGRYRLVRREGGEREGDDAIGRRFGEPVPWRGGLA